MDKHFFSALVFTVIICHGLPNSYNLFLPKKKVSWNVCPFLSNCALTASGNITCNKKKGEKEKLHRGNFLSKSSCLRVLFYTYGRFLTVPHHNWLASGLLWSHHEELENFLWPNLWLPKILVLYSGKLIGIHCTKIAKKLKNCGWHTEK